VFYPSSVVLENEATTPIGMLDFVVTYFKEIYWAKIPDGDKTRSMIEDEL
jgi:hypothetical protein